MSNSETFRVRFRFRLQKRLNIESKEYRFNVGTYEVVLSPQSSDLNICDSEWLVMYARGFESENQAKMFSERLKTACEVSSIATRLGVDTGINLPTTSVGEEIKKLALEQSGIMIRDNIHGIDVFPDGPKVTFIQSNATLTALTLPDPFLSDLSNLYNVVENPSQQTRDIALLLNFALMRPEPVAQVVYCFSAVEMLGQNEEWNVEQKQLLAELANMALKSDIGTETDRDEVVSAIRKGLHKLSLRQGVLRLLSSLELDHLKPIWDELYGQRSTLVHGLAPRPGVDYHNLAFKTVNLCGRILLKAIAREINGADNHIEKFYPLS